MEVQNNGYWGTICDDHWTIREANVVCRSMGYGTAEIATKNAYYGRGIGKVSYLAQETLSSTFTIIYTQWYFLIFLFICTVSSASNGVELRVLSDYSRLPKVSAFP